MNISTVIARHKSIFHASHPPTQEAVSIRVEIPAVKAIPITALPKKEKLVPLLQVVENNSSKAFLKPKSIDYPKIEGGGEASPSPSFGEDELLHYLRRKRAHLPQNMEADNYD